ncbi:MAG: tRNA (adenosine(37)-N6)-threonylcarbamoyltransferase complex ATPase subunit type 1 TsaE [Myxococcaceae bacterium]
MVTARDRTLDTFSAEETHVLGEKLGRLLQPGDFVGLMGELGAGKTQFARGVASGAQVPKEQVASPTFAIIYPYDGRIRLYHADLYRLGDADELYATGFYDLVGSDGALLVEWVDRIAHACPEEHLRIELSTIDDNRRRFRIRAVGPRPVTLLEAWLGP